MCGICGFTWPDRSTLQAMVQSLRHRGPDAEGAFVDDHVSLGHARLSVLDLSKTGAQPMVSDDQQTVISYNGEIYNFPELRSELQALGVEFRGSSDTEVLLKGYRQWGPDVFERCNGMWAVCIYDLRSRKLILARDRLGVKPLYYTMRPQGLAFASEIQTLLQIVDDPKVDPEAIDLLLSSQFIPSPRSIYQGISKLEPRHVLTYELDAGKVTQRPIFELPTYRPSSDRKALIEEGTALFEDAVRIRMVSDVPVGAFLSGGLDSTAVVGAMARRVPRDKLHTVSAGFDIPGLDETRYINIAHKLFQTNHHHIEFRSDTVTESLDAVAHAYGEPVVDPSSLPTYEVCREARRWMTVALSGDGADEVFGGYSSRFAASAIERLMAIPRPLRRMLLSALSKGAGNAHSRMGKAHEALRVSLLEKSRYFSEIGAGAVYRPDAFKQWAESRLGQMLELTGNNLLEAMLRFDLHHNRLSDNYCAKVDRMSMAHSLEVRSPFLDYRFVEYASRIPVKWKLNRGHTKILMREIAHDFVPREILERKKHGFAAPVGVWADEHLDELRQAVDIMHEAGALNDHWRTFYQDTVFAHANWLTREYRKRLAILWAWYRVWILNERSDQAPVPKPTPVLTRDAS